MTDFEDPTGEHSKDEEPQVNLGEAITLLQSIKDIPAVRHEVVEITDGVEYQGEFPLAHQDLRARGFKLMSITTCREVKGDVSYNSTDVVFGGGGEYAEYLLREYSNGYSEWYLVKPDEVHGLADIAQAYQPGQEKEFLKHLKDLAEQQAIFDEIVGNSEKEVEISSGTPEANELVELLRLAAHDATALRESDNE